jgi:hypothetical protein
VSGRPINALELYSRFKDQWDTTSQPLKERASILPFGQYEDGSVGLAFPGILAAPAEGMVNFGRYGYDSEEAIRDNAASAFDVAGGAVTGGLGVGLAGGLADNAVGSAGARARPFEMLLDDAANLPSRAPAEFQAGAKPLAYDLVQNGDDIGRIEMMINPQRGEAFIDNFVSGGGSNSLGLGGIRAIRDALRELHPEVKRFSGFRDVDMKTGGARAGADAAGYPNDKMQSFDFYSNAPTASSIPLASEAQDTDPALLEYLRLTGQIRY